MGPLAGVAVPGAGEPEFRLLLAGRLVCCYSSGFPIRCHGGLLRPGGQWPAQARQRPGTVTVGSPQDTVSLRLRDFKSPEFKLPLAVSDRDPTRRGQVANPE